MFWRYTRPVGPLGCNCSIVADLHAGEAIVVDPGGEPAHLLQVLAEHSLRVRAIVHTHAHIDHVYATAELAEATGAAAYLHGADRPMYDALEVQAAMLGIAAPRRDAMVGQLRDEQSLAFGQYELGVLHTPGHSPGSVSFAVPGQCCCMTGDTLFAGTVGRTDLWGGDANALKRSISERLLVMDGDTVVVPGHGKESSMAAEQRGWAALSARL